MYFHFCSINFLFRPGLSSPSGIFVLGITDRHFWDVCSLYKHASVHGMGAPTFYFALFASLFHSFLVSPTFWDLQTVRRNSMFITLLSLPFFSFSGFLTYIIPSNKLSALLGRFLFWTHILTVI